MLFDTEGAFGLILVSVFGVGLYAIHTRLPGRKRREQAGDLIVAPFVWLFGLPHVVGEPVVGFVQRKLRRFT